MVAAVTTPSSLTPPMIAVATKLSSVTTAAKDAAHGVNTQLAYIANQQHCLGTRLGDISSEPMAMLPDSTIPLEHGEDTWLGDNTRGNAAGNTLHTPDNTRIRDTTCDTTC